MMSTVQFDDNVLYNGETDVLTIPCGVANNFLLGGMLINPDGSLILRFPDETGDPSAGVAELTVPHGEANEYMPEEITLNNDGSLTFDFSADTY